MTDNNKIYTPPTAPLENQRNIVASNQHLNPWISIWTKPRATVQQLVDTNPNYYVLILAALSGMTQILSQASSNSTGDQLDFLTILLIALFAGPLLGLLTLYLAGFLIFWTGKWLNGQATAKTIRTAVAWSNIPVVLSLLIWIPEVALIREELFTTATPQLEANPTLSLVLLVLSLVNVVLAVWGVVILVKGIGQVQAFSAWRGLGNFILALLAIFIPVFIVVMLIASVGSG